MKSLTWAAITTFMADQISKLVVVRAMDLRTVGEIDILPPLVNFRMAWNYGVNFGLFAENTSATRWILIAVALLISGVVFWLTWREKPGRWGQISAGLLIGGAIGNVVDRLIYGAVADFLNVSCCGIDNPYAFNIADIAIFAGAIGMLIFGGGKKSPPLTRRKKRA